MNKKKIIITFSLLVAITVTGIARIKNKTTKTIDQLPAITAEEIIQEKIKNLQDDVLAQLANCESGNTKEPDGAIILDTNGQMSIGRYMYQIDTVQRFVKHFYKKDITRREAIIYAVTPEKSTELTRRILFEYENGARNWYNCSKKLNIPQQVKLIKKLN